MAMMFAHQQVAVGKLRSPFSGLQASNTELGKDAGILSKQKRIGRGEKKGRTANRKAENKRGNKETNENKTGFHLCPASTSPYLLVPWPAAV